MNATNIILIIAIATWLYLLNKQLPLRKLVSGVPGDFHLPWAVIKANTYHWHGYGGILLQLIVTVFVLVLSNVESGIQVAIIGLIVNLIFWIGKEIISGLVKKVDSDAGDVRFSMYGALLVAIIEVPLISLYFMH